MAGLAVLASSAALMAVPAQADPARVAAGQPPVQARSVADRFNEGAAHSPQLERMLAGATARPPGPEAGRRSPRQSASARSAASAQPAASASPSAAGASTVEGLDVASFQHPSGAAINWSAVAGAGYRFAFIKATEGSYYVNPYYAGDSEQAQAAGLIAAPYAFAIPNYSGGAFQADYVLDHADYAADGQMLAPILDIEYDPYAASDGTNTCYGLSSAQMVSWIKAFTTETQRRTGKLPVIYTTADWWGSCTANSTAFGADPLWIAGETSSGPIMPPSSAWAGWTYWQYTASATLASAITGSFDASWLSSTALGLAAPATQSNSAGATVSLTLNSLDGSTTAATYSATGLPSGVSINASTGVVSGSLPAGAATFPVSVTASATGAPSVTQRFTWYAHGKASFGRLATQHGTVATPARLSVPVSDGLSGCTLQFRASGLPRGLSISSCGLISGWPSASGHPTVTVSVTDSSGSTLATHSFSWEIGRASGQGPAGQIKLRRDGKCLEVRSTSDIAIGTCSSSSKQRWTITADGRVRNGADCLAAAVKTGKAALSLNRCSSSAQRWQLGSGGSLTNLSTKTCLVDTGTKNASRAYAAACSGSTSQQWTLPAGPLTSGIPGRCASSLHGVTLRPCNGLAQQAWTVSPNGHVTDGGKCLGLVDGKTAKGMKLSLVSCSASAGQVWQVTGGPLSVQIVSQVAGLCLSDPGDATKSGTALRLEPCVAADPGVAWRVS